MPLFQKNVLKDYLKNQDQQAVDKAFKVFSAYFHDAGIQKNIRNSKEEQFQATFLSRLFVDVLGYTLFPDKEYNLTTEFTNEVGARKADGAILSPTNGGRKAIAVIELKSTKTKDLESIRKQAFDYKANHSECRYVITSNFEKLRFYVNDAVDWLEFDLFNGTKEDFAALHLCLQKDNLLNDLPQKIKSDSLIREEKVTKILYKDYSLFRMELFRDLVNRNRKNPLLKEHSEKSVKFTLFKKTQKLLDRFLFIFFAEDRGLIPRNMIKQVNNEWKELQKLRGTQTLYDRYKIYFNDLNIGNRDHDIFAYNGGLFEPDPILDHAEIDDALLFKHTEKLTAYDFESEVDVNILGHIFEHSLNEIESVNAEIEGVDFDKQKARRKKDGVFYTPKYITKYIVDNTLGKLCEEKKAEMGLNEEVFSKNYQLKGQRTEKKETQVMTRKEILTATKQVKTKVSVEGGKILEKLNDYNEWLLQLTICDPACGSGAFLNQALEFLIAEHRQIDEWRAKLLSVPIAYSDIENSILENNLYGVDINQESVDIAKLSLWLRTAQRGRKLTSLSNNIKCGNSLIDSVAVAGDKAFKWEKEFPEVFEQGGFDVVIGNPPYGIFIDEVEDEYYKENYPNTKYKINLYILFIERMFHLFNKGVCHFIIPKSLLFNTYFADIRKLLLEESLIHEIFMLTEKVFTDAEVGGSLLLKFSPNQLPIKRWKTRLITAETYFDHELNKSKVAEIDQNFFLSVPHYEISPITEASSKLVRKLHSMKTIKDFYDLKNGLNPGNIKHVLISGQRESDNHRPIIWGKEISRYGISWGGDFINYDPELKDKLTLADIKSKEGMNKQTRIDFALRDPSMFEVDKILIRKTGDKFTAAKDTDRFYFDTLVHGIYESDEKYPLDYLLAILNSNPGTEFYRLLHDIKGKVFAKISLDKLGSFPIPTGNEHLRITLIGTSVKIQGITREVQRFSESFLNHLKAKFDLKDYSRNLQNWPSLDFKGFLKELKKAKVQLSLAEEAEWMDYFNQQKTRVQELQKEVDTLDNEIDQMVYALYGLSEEEIGIVEGV